MPMKLSTMVDWLGGDVKTIRIENINGGRVKGKISYKSPDEHK